MGSHCLQACQLPRKDTSKYKYHALTERSPPLSAASGARQLGYNRLLFHGEEPPGDDKREASVSADFIEPPETKPCNFRATEMSE